MIAFLYLLLCALTIFALKILTGLEFNDLTFWGNAGLIYLFVALTVSIFIHKFEEFLIDFNHTYRTANRIENMLDNFEYRYRNKKTSLDSLTLDSAMPDKLTESQLIQTMIYNLSLLNSKEFLEWAGNNSSLTNDNYTDLALLKLYLYNQRIIKSHEHNIIGNLLFANKDKCTNDISHHDFLTEILKDL